jgi:hypothetical protein
VISTLDGPVATRASRNSGPAIEQSVVPSTQQAVAHCAELKRELIPNDITPAEGWTRTIIDNGIQIWEPPSQQRRGLPESFDTFMRSQSSLYQFGVSENASPFAPVLAPSAKRNAPTFPPSLARPAKRRAGPRPPVTHHRPSIAPKAPKDQSSPPSQPTIAAKPTQPTQPNIAAKPTQPTFDQIQEMSERYVSLAKSSHSGQGGGVRESVEGTSQHRNVPQSGTRRKQDTSGIRIQPTSPNPTPVQNNKNQSSDQDYAWKLKCALDSRLSEEDKNPTVIVDMFTKA